MAGEGSSNGNYPRVLDREGCVYGQHLHERMTEMVECYEELKRKLDRIQAWLVGATLTLGTAALMLGINLALGWLTP